MTLYEKFKKLDIDFSHISLEQGDTHSDYFCTPQGAEVIGWAGVDGIHCCFVKGFGETVFTISPMNTRGNYVKPVANTFEDFLRLLLACGGVDAVEQAWMWNRGEFNAFLETYPPNDEQQIVLDKLRDSLSLTPMDDPYGYIKEVQSAFDYSKLSFPKEYYELGADKPEIETPPERPEWKVYFENGFGSYHSGHDKPGVEIPVNKTFTWGGRTWRIPAVYSCGKGLVVDFCVEVDLNVYRTFVEKWRPWWEEDRSLTPEDEERRDAENPLTIDFNPKVAVNGRELRPRSGNGSCWVPMTLRQEYEQGEYRQRDWGILWLMEHYGLDAEKGWVFWRQSFPWTTKTKPVLKTLAMSLEMDKRAIPGPRFTVSDVGDAIPFTHPIAGEKHTLRVVEVENQKADLSHLDGSFEYPTHYAVLSYVIEPELPRDAMTVRDCGQGDSPRPKPLEELAALAAIGGADGPTAILLANGKTGHPHSVCSALRFEQPERVEWRMVFYHKTVEDITIDLPLPQN